MPSNKRDLDAFEADVTNWDDLINSDHHDMFDAGAPSKQQPQELVADGNAAVDDPAPDSHGDRRAQDETSGLSFESSMIGDDFDLTEGQLPPYRYMPPNDFDQGMSKLAIAGPVNSPKQPSANATTAQDSDDLLDPESYEDLVARLGVAKAAALAAKFEHSGQATLPSGYFDDHNSVAENAQPQLQSPPVHVSRPGPASVGLEDALLRQPLNHLGQASRTQVQQAPKRQKTNDHEEHTSRQQATTGSTSSLPGFGQNLESLSQRFPTLTQGAEGFAFLATPGYLQHAHSSPPAQGAQPVINTPSTSSHGSSFPLPAQNANAAANLTSSAPTQQVAQPSQTSAVSTGEDIVGLKAIARIGDHLLAPFPVNAQKIYGDRPHSLVGHEKTGGDFEDNADGEDDNEESGDDEEARQPKKARKKGVKRAIVEWEDGVMYTRETPDHERAPAAYLADVHNHFNVTVDQAGNGYLKAPTAGRDHEDVTAYFPAHRSWKVDRHDGRPASLFWYGWPNGKKPNFRKPGLLKDAQGRILLCPNNLPIKAHPGMPLTISTKIEPYRIEAIRRYNPDISMEDFRQRMRPGKRPTAHWLSVQVCRERQRMRILSIVSDSGKDGDNVFTEHLRAEMQAHPQAIARNSTKGLADIDHAKWKKLTKYNYGSDLHKAGTQEKVSDSKRYKTLKANVPLAEKDFGVDSVIAKRVRKSLEDFERGLAEGRQRGSRYGSSNSNGANVQQSDVAGLSTLVGSQDASQHGAQSNSFAGPSNAGQHGYSGSSWQVQPTDFAQAGPSNFGVLSQHGTASDIPPPTAHQTSTGHTLGNSNSAFGEEVEGDFEYDMLQYRPTTDAHAPFNRNTAGIAEAQQFGVAFNTPFLTVGHETRQGSSDAAFVGELGQPDPTAAAGHGASIGFNFPTNPFAGVQETATQATAASALSSVRKGKRKADHIDDCQSPKRARTEVVPRAESDSPAQDHLSSSSDMDAGDADFLARSAAPLPANAHAADVVTASNSVNATSTAEQADLGGLVPDTGAGAGAELRDSQFHLYTDVYFGLLNEGLEELPDDGGYA